MGSSEDDKAGKDVDCSPAAAQLPAEAVEQAYSEERFWAKLKRYAGSAGKDVVEAALKLFYALQDKDTPASAKAIIVGALAYFIIPFDAVADLLPGGYVDDWGALMGALWTVAKHIKDEHKQRAQAKLREWFPEQDDAGLNPDDKSGN